MFSCCVVAQPVDDGTFLVDDSSSSKGKGKGRRHWREGGDGTKWQIELSDQWKDYGDQEDAILKRAYMLGQKSCRFHLRDQTYEYDFKKMVQKNKDSGKKRSIRPPFRGPRPPAKPLLPEGPMCIITVQPGQAGQVINHPDPNNPGSFIPVYVPPHAKPGAKLAIPIPPKGESVASVQKKQEALDAKTGTKTGWSTGAKVAAGGAALAGIAAVGVGGVILGDHLAGGDMASTIGEGVIDGGEAIGDAAGDAADAIGDWAPDAADAVGDGASDAMDWLGDAGGDAGDFIMDLF